MLYSLLAMNEYQGEIIAVLTSLCWSVSPFFFSRAGKAVGSSTVNHIRLWIALVALMIIHSIAYNNPLPFGIESYRVRWLALSGFIGFVFGDSCFFEALVLLGPRLSSLLMLLAPIFSTILAWIFLGEKLNLYEIIAILVTTGGIASVVSETSHNSHPKPQTYIWGLFLGIGAATGQAGGLLCSKIGMKGSFPPISSNIIRIATAAICLSIFALLQGKFRNDIKKMKIKNAFRTTFAGAMIGPTMGVVLALYAISHTSIGIASTLMSLSPIFMLPLSHYIDKERISRRTIIGTFISLAGASLLFFL